jgi:hypothetical protein
MHRGKGRVRRPALTVWALFLGMAAASNAQDRQEAHDGSEPFGRVISPFTVDALIQRSPTQAPAAAARTQREEKKASYGFLASPVAVDSKGAFISGLTLGATRSGGHPLQLKSSYKQISNDGGGNDRDKLGVSGKVGLFAAGAITVGVNGDYGRVRKRSGRFDGVLAADATLGKGFGATANIGVTTFRPEGGSRTTDRLAGIGLSYQRSAVSVGVDYAIKNHVDGEDDSSLSVTQLLAGLSSSLTASIGKHGLVRIAYLVRF